MPKTDKESNDNIEQELDESTNLRVKSIIWYCGVILFTVLLIGDIATTGGKNIVSTAIFYLITSWGASKYAFALRKNFFDWIILILCLPFFIIRFIFKNIFSGTSSSYTQKEDSNYIYIDCDGYKKRLKYLDRTFDINPTGGTHYYYNRYKDDSGYIWRSYDNGKTFKKE